MDENVIFQGEFRWDLRAHKEFSTLNLHAQFRNTFLLLINIVCMIFLIFMLPYGTSPMMLILLSLFWLGLFVFRWFRERDGGLAYKRMLRSNSGKIPHSRLLFGETGIRTIHLNINQEVTIAYNSIRYLMESRNLLMLVDDLKMCLIIDKSTLEGGTREELVAWLRNKCPNLKKHIRTGLLGRIVFYLFIAVNILALVFSLAHLLEIPEKMSGQLPNTMSYQEIAEELRPLGIHISQESIHAMQQFDAENKGNSLLDTRTKVLNLLCWEGQGFFEEVEFAPNAFDLRWTPSYSGVYWFDLEVFGFGNIYSNFLTGISAMDSSLVFTNVEEFYAVDILEGQGEIPVSFDYLGKHYEFEAQYNYDWFDTDMIYYLGRILAADENPKDLWMTYEGQGILLYYGTEENKNLLEKKTGIDFFDCVTIRIGH